MSDIRDLLRDFKDGKIDEETLLKMMRLDYIENLDDMAQLDIFRHERTGVPEVIFAQSKSNDALKEIIEKFLLRKDSVLISRINDDQVEIIENLVKNRKDLTLDLNKIGKVAKIYKNHIKTSDDGKNPNKSQGKVGIITAGTSDIPIAEEVKMVVEAMGVETFTSYDIGIAGFHRIFKPLKKMLTEEVDAFVVIAGMEGTLPGVVSALVNVPVIGVPTSTGYGYKGKGIGALTTMLQSCSPGLVVVNIDNGFGAGASAALIANNAHKKNN